MLAFIARRLGALIVVLFGSSFILYNLAAISGDPIGALRFSDDREAEALIKELEEFLRLDVPPLCDISSGYEAFSASLLEMLILGRRDYAAQSPQNSLPQYL